MAKTKKRSTAAKIINIILTIILLTVLLLLSVNAIRSAVDKDYVFSIFGYQFYTVVSDSMDPFIPVGSLVISKNVNAKTQFNKGDVLTFNTKNFFSGEKMVVTHYFREIAQDETGRFQYVTYSEKEPDGDHFFVERSQIRGKYVTHAPWVGKLAMFLKSRVAIIMYAVIIIIILAASYYFKKVNKPKKEDEIVSEDKPLE